MLLSLVALITAPLGSGPDDGDGTRDPQTDAAATELGLDLVEEFVGEASSDG